MPETESPADRVHTPLLALITAESLDQSYLQAARERGTAPNAQDGGRSRWAAVAVVAVFGVMVTVAAVQTSRGSGVATANRDSLLRQIEEGNAHSADLERKIVDLRAANVGLRDDLDKTTKAQQAATQRNTTMAARAGFAPVHGPGVVITVDDAPNGEAVRDEDLAKLVNGLWEAGAEAISINGKRLTGKSALRNGGAAINLNGPPPLSPPYVVAAVGDNRTLQANLLETTTGREFTDLADALGFPVKMAPVQDITLPAGPARQLQMLSAVEGTAKKNNSAKKQGPTQDQTQGKEPS